jgi:outer membrane autotransporter protein
LTISDGGQVYNSYYGYIGYDEQSSNNTVLVSGDGSVWTNSESLRVGYNGSDNGLTVSDGGQVYNNFGAIGRNGNSSNNVALVTGAGSVWVNNQNLRVGIEGSGNHLTIAGGGHVYNKYGYIGYDEQSSNNTALVSGTGSIWTNSGNLRVGYNGSGNSLTVSDGGQVYNDFGVIGRNTNSSNNVALVTGAGSVWVNNQNLRVGYEGSGNHMTISDGGRVYNTLGNIGRIKSSVSNSVLVTGSGSEWHNDKLVIGPWGSHNTLEIMDGGFVGSSTGYVGRYEVAVDNMAAISGSGSVWSNSHDLYIGEFGYDNHLFVANGGRVENMTGYIGYDAIASGNSAVVSGDGTVWDNSSQLHVGYNRSGNTLEILDGALVANYHGIIGETSNAWNNSVSVVGAGSEWRNQGDLYIGGRMSQVSYMIEDEWFTPWIDGGQGNSLYVGDGGLVTVGRDMHNRNHSLVSIDQGGHIDISNNYYQDATSVLRFGVETNAAGAPLNALVSVGGTAEFEKGATLQYHSNVGVLDFGTFYTNLIVEADELIIGGVKNANSLDLTAINLDGSLVDLLLWEQDQDIYGLIGRRYLADSAGFTAGSQMARLSREIDDMSLLGDPNAVAQINLLNGLSSAQQKAQIVQHYGHGTPNYAHAQGMTEGMDEIKKHTTRHQQVGQESAEAPAGPAGPHRPDQGWQGWVKPYGVWADYSAQGGFSGYNHNIYGTLVGADRREGDALIGLAGGYVRSNIKQDDGDDSKSKTGYGVLFASWGTEDWFSDFNIGFGRSEIDQRSGTLFDSTAEYDARNYAFYFGGGKEMKLSDGRFLFTPKASMLWSYYAQEGYTDESTIAVTREVDPYDRDSFLSSLGASFAFQNEYDIMVVKPEARLFWLHEFNADVEQVDYTLSNGGGQYHFLMPAPIEDVIEVGLGISCRFHDELDLVFDIDGRFGEDYSAYALSGRVVFEF